MSLSIGASDPVESFTSIVWAAVTVPSHGLRDEIVYLIALASCSPTSTRITAKITPGRSLPTVFLGDLG